MPELDPRWEYYIPDPEIEEVIAERLAPRKYDALDANEEETRYHKTNVGFRFGKGNPNFTKFRFGKPKPERRERPVKQCATCGELFRSNASKYCSTTCRGLSVRNPEVPCARCGKVFLRKHWYQQYCSRKCIHPPGRSGTLVCARCGKTFKYRTRGKFCSAGCAGTRDKKGWNEFENSRLLKLFNAGLPMAELEKECDRVARVLQRHLRKLGADRRPAGNHNKARIKAMTKKPVSINDVVRVRDPSNSTFDGLLATVKVVHDWGAVVGIRTLTADRPPKQVEKEFRVLFSEVDYIGPLPPAVAPKPEPDRPQSVGMKASAVQAKQMGYTGDVCRQCGGVRMVLSGAGGCQKCEDCGSTTGCS